MIQVTVKRVQNHIQELEVKGHANSDTYGHDLVCAIVSGITVGLANALVEMVQEDDIIVEEGFVRICIHHMSQRTDDILNSAVVMLKTAEEVNQDYLKVTEG